jgi:hypothetical protein
VFCLAASPSISLAVPINIRSTPFLCSKLGKHLYHHDIAWEENSRKVPFQILVELLHIMCVISLHRPETLFYSDVQHILTYCNLPVEGIDQPHQTTGAQIKATNIAVEQ